MGTDNMAKWNQPHLRVVTTSGEIADPRKYAQSTSGRVSSTGTAPPLSRASEIESDSRMRSLVESALRKYPSEVPQRPAKSSCSLVSSELRYVRKDSIDMARSLPFGNYESIPDGKLPIGICRYHVGMKLDDLDKRRTENFLRLLRDQYRDSPKEFEIATGYSANMVSQIRTGKKFVRDKLARKLEKIAKLPALTFDQSEPGMSPSRAPTRLNSWPLSVPLEQFAALSPKLQRELDEAFTKMVMGAQAQDLISKQAKKRTG
jgi:transcriptional regulator with XRE-family HTH domain